MVEVLVDLLGLAVLAEHAAEDTHAALPDELEGEPRVGGTPALTGTGVPAFPALRQMKMHSVGEVVSDGRRPQQREKQRGEEGPFEYPSLACMFCTFLLGARPAPHMSKQEWRS